MDNRKIIVAFYVAASMVLWFLSRQTLAFLHSSFYQIRRLPGISAVGEILPVVLALVCFFVLLQNPKVNTVLEEVVSELKKVTWPGREEVVRSTIVVIVCIAIASAILGAFDVLFGKLVGLALKS